MSDQQQQQPTYDPEHLVAEWVDKVILEPSEVEHVWNAEDPKQFMSDMINRLVKEKVGKLGSEWNRHSQYESRWEKAECTLIGEYCLQALVYLRGDLKVADSFAIGAVTNAFFDLLMTFQKSDGSLRVD